MNHASAAAPAPTDAFFFPLTGSLDARWDAALVHDESRRLPSSLIVIQAAASFARVSFSVQENKLVIWFTHNKSWRPVKTQ